MGRDKALLPLASLHNKYPNKYPTTAMPPATSPVTFLTQQVATLSALCQDVVLVARDQAQAALYASLYPVFPPTLHSVLDQQPDIGPLMGLYSGLCILKALQADCALVTAVDAPLLHPDFAAWLLAQASASEIIMPVVAGVPQVLLALYPRAIVPLLEELLQAGERGPRAILRAAPERQIAVRYIEEAQLRIVDPQLRSFLDVDTPEEFAALNASSDPIDY